MQTPSSEPVPKALGSFCLCISHGADPLGLAVQHHQRRKGPSLGVCPCGCCCPSFRGAKGVAPWGLTGSHLFSGERAPPRPFAHIPL